MQQTDWILRLDQVDAELELAGGKGLNLIRLMRAGMPVPPGFIVSTVMYQAFVEANQLDERIRAILPSGQPLGVVSAQIRAAFASGRFPDDVAAQVRAAYQDLCSRTGQFDLPVAVRSSATAEDLAEASFAGQQDTYLNVCGEQALLKAIQRCFGSLWSERAIDYRARQGLQPMAARLAVVVQEMVLADAAGVAFTADPLSGDPHHMVINATWGTGEALVSGLVTPDHIIVDKRTGEILAAVIAVKAEMVVPTPEGTAVHPVPHSRQRARVLADGQVREIVELGKRIESVYGRPQDLEWCLARERLYILQARPITTLPEAPIFWDAPGEGQWLHGGGTFEMITEPISPLFETFLLPIFARMLIALMESSGLGNALPRVPFQVVNGYIYLHMALRLRPQHLVGLWRDFATHMNSMQDQTAEQDLYRQAVAGLAQPPLKELSGADILNRMDALGRAAMRYWLQIMKVVQVIYRQERRFVEFYNRRARRKDDADPEVFIRGQKIRPWEAEGSAFALAQLASQLDGVPQLLRGDVDRDLAALQESAAGRGFLAALDKHLALYGHQLASFDLLLPTLADDPRPVLAQVRAFLDGKESPGERQRRMEREREEAVKVTLGRLGPRDQRRFLRLLDRARFAARTREDALFDVGLAWTEMHRGALELGRRFVQAGILQAPDDVFWLRLQEVQAAVTELDGSRTAISRQDFVEERRYLAGLWSQVEPPYLLPVGSHPAFWWGWVFPTPELQRHPNAHTLVGLGVSPGRVTATARVLRRLEEMDQLNAGEILVAHTTTPAWTPLFARAVGLVTDLGGPLAHGSIIAREYGIPAVMGTGNATRKIQSGQTITVYGSEGKVRIE